MSADIIAAQSSLIEPEAFQASIIANATQSLLKESPAPILVRAPTGSGKTFMITKILDGVSNESATLWFWFVPFVNLIQQTEDSIAANALVLTPVPLARGRNQEPKSGLVVISTAAAVAKAKSRREGYTDGVDDDSRSIDSQIALARARGLKIGLVVDEAHIGLDTQTEFGQFAAWLKPDRMLMATATPKDQRLIDFIQSAGYSSYQTFVASRDDVVAARLNKRYIEAIVYDLRQSIQTVTDLQQTVLKQAWRQNQRLHALLHSLEINVVPLLLVQVANGDKTVEDARDQLMKLCNVPPSAIGVHSAAEPDPVLMASIANDTTKQVLIFKQSAGTGFDAPRAFVLASTKPVNDQDFAAQFIGRVMRVHRAIRSKYPREAKIDPILDTAYIYLANAQAQQGFEQAVSATANLKSELEGQSEKLVQKKTIAGAIVYTNKEAEVEDFFPDTPLPQQGAVPTSKTALPTSTIGSTQVLPGFTPPQGLDGLDAVAQAYSSVPAAAGALPAKKKIHPKNRGELISALSDVGIKAFNRKPAAASLPLCLKTEDKPELANMANASRAAATKLEIAHLVKGALDIAFDRVKEKEHHTELTTGQKKDQKVSVVLDRAALAREADAALKRLPQAEEEDARIILDVLTRRLQGYVCDELDDDSRDDAELVKRLSRTAAFAIIRKESETLAELLYEEISNQAVTTDAEPLPDALLFASEIALEQSAKNIYGILPPSIEEVTKLPEVLTIDMRQLMAERILGLDDGACKLAPLDGAWALGHEERAFAKALDRADFVNWWHRNPDRKGFSVRIVRGEHKNYFYPDFIVCLEHFPGDKPLMRLVETKESIKDAVRKSKRSSPVYGPVLFMTKDMSKWKWITKEGALGSEIDLDDLVALQEWMRASVPTLPV